MYNVFKRNERDEFKSDKETTKYVEVSLDKIKEILKRYEKTIPPLCTDTNQITS